MNLEGMYVTRNMCQTQDNLAVELMFKKQGRPFLRHFDRQEWFGGTVDITTQTMGRVQFINNNIVPNVTKTSKYNTASDKFF